MHFITRIVGTPVAFLAALFFLIMAYGYNVPLALREYLSNRSQARTASM